MMYGLFITTDLLQNTSMHIHYAVTTALSQNTSMHIHYAVTTALLQNTSMHIHYAVTTDLLKNTSMHIHYAVTTALLQNTSMHIHYAVTTTLLPIATHPRTSTHTRAQEEEPTYEFHHRNTLLLLCMLAHFYAHPCARTHKKRSRLTNSAS